MKKYRFFDHTADIGCEISGKSRKELFANAATALFDLIFDRLPNRENHSPTTRKTRRDEKTIILEGNDLEDLLINFLREILYLFNGKNLITDECHIVELSTRHVVALLRIERYKPQKHPVHTEIKAVTYHGVRISKTINGWKARVICDV